MNIPLNIDWQQIFLHLLNFAILTMGLHLLLYKPVKDFMEKRIAHYSEMDNEAKEGVERAESLQTSYQERLSNIEAEIVQKRAKAAQEAEQAAAAVLQNANERAEKLLSDTQQAAEQEKARIVESAQDEIASMAIAATEKLLTQSSSRSLDEFLDAVKKG